MGKWLYVIVGGLFLFVVFLVVLIAVSGGEGDSDAKAAEVPDELEAWVMCQNFVEDKLKAPASADFPGWSSGEHRIANGIDFPTDPANPAWTVQSYVDSQNSFGAMIRTNFTCQVEFLGDDQWSGRVVFP